MAGDYFRAMGIRFGEGRALGAHDDVEFATFEWVAWFNTCRLRAPLGYRPPAEYEAQCHEA